MFSKAHLIFIILACSGCTPGFVPVYIDEDEPEPLKTATQDAVDFWNDAIGFDALEYIELDPGEIGFIDSFSIVIASQGRVVGSVDNQANTGHALLVERIAVEHGALDERSDMTSDEQRTVVAWLLIHEMGHALGLGHYTERDNVMFHDPWIGEEGFDTTLKQRRRVRALTTVRLGL
jgi:hypothetical protein